MALGGNRLRRRSLLTGPEGQRFKLLCPSSSKVWGKKTFAGPYSSPSRSLIGVSVPKRPSFSLLIPAVKNNVFAAPAFRVVPERERPETIDGYERIVFVLQESDEFVREAVERGDPAAAEISRTVARREHSAVNRELQIQ